MFTCGTGGACILQLVTPGKTRLHVIAIREVFTNSTCKRESFSEGWLVVEGTPGSVMMDCALLYVLMIFLGLQHDHSSAQHCAQTGTLQREILRCSRASLIVLLNFMLPS